MIKKEMMQETMKEYKDEANRQKIRSEKAHAERMENVKKLMVDTRLRSEIEIANERPEGSPMSKGGRDDILKTDKKDAKDDADM